MMPLPLRLRLLAVAALLVPALAAAQSAPWTVFTEEAMVRAEPRAEAREITRLPRGAEVSGEILVNPETDEEWIAFARGEGFAHVSMTHLMRVHPDNVVAGNLPIGAEMVDRWWGLPLEYEPSDLVEIPARLCVRHDRAYLLRRAARNALTAMLDAALADGVDIQVNSAHRSGAQQRRTYLRAVERHGRGQRASARPGHSEHQLGTTVDLTDPAGEHAFTPEFATSPQGRWLTAHAGEFGFVRSYTDGNVAETGYMSEPWHWRLWGNSTARD